GAAHAVPREQPHRRQRQRRLARAALADDADDAAARHLERHAAQRMHEAARRLEIDAEILDRKDAGCRHHTIRRSFGSNMSRRDSPRKVKPSVVMMSGMPPATTIQGASRMKR